MRKDDPRAGEARKADVGERSERYAVVPHPGDRVQGRRRSGAMVGADRRQAERGQLPGRLLRGDPGQRLALLVEGHQRHDGQSGDTADGADRAEQLLQLVERLDHEEVDAATLENRRLLRVQLLARLRPQLRVAERPDRARDEDVPSGDLAGLPREADTRRVDPLELALEEMAGQLRPVGAEGVRLDHVRAGADVRDVHRDDALRARGGWPPPGSAVPGPRSGQARPCRRRRRARSRRLPL